MWQRDVAASHAELADALLKGGQLPEAREHLVSGRDIIAKLVAQYPDWTQWNSDLDWFNKQLASLGGAEAAGAKP